MRRMTLFRIAACLLAYPASYGSALVGVKAGVLIGGFVFPQAHAQQPPPSGFTPQELDRMSQDRTRTFGPVKHGRPPPQSEVAQERTYPPGEMWICKSVAPWQPVYSQADIASPQIGKTMTMIAVGGRDQNGFARTLFPNGRIGWVPASQIHDYMNRFNPQATCQVNAVRANGGPIFDVR